MSSNDKKIAFRVDASSQIGTGHLYRSIVLGHEFKKRGWKVTFVGNPLGPLSLELQKHNFVHHSLIPTEAKTVSSQQSKANAYEYWLSSPWRIDAKQTI